MHKEVLQIIKKEKPIEKWAKDLSRYLIKEDIQMMKKHIKRCAISLVIMKV